MKMKSSDNFAPTRSHGMVFHAFGCPLHRISLKMAAVFLTILFGIPTMAWASKKEERTKPMSFDGHRIFCWFVDGDGKIVGMADRTLRPGESLKFEAPGNGVLSMRWEAVNDKKSAFSINFQTAEESGYSDLVNPFCLVIYDSREKVKVMHGILFIAPVPCPFKGVAGLLSKEYTGSRGELEDLLLASVLYPKIPRWAFDLPTLHFAYTVLKHSERVQEWKQLLKGDKFFQQALAAAILMKVNDSDGVKVFYKICTKAEGQLQIQMVDRLLNEKPSPARLKAIVELLGAGKPDHDGEDVRPFLIDALLRGYRLEETREYLQKLLATPGAYGKKEIEEYLRKEGKP